MGVLVIDDLYHWCSTARPSARRLKHGGRQSSEDATKGHVGVLGGDCGMSETEGGTQGTSSINRQPSDRALVVECETGGDRSDDRRPPDNLHKLEGGQNGHSGNDRQPPDSLHEPPCSSHNAVATHSEPGPHSRNGPSLGRTTGQRNVLGMQEVLAALAWLATMHAAFWQEPSVQSKSARSALPLESLWEHGEAQIRQ
jgi:hypothetical protein